MIGDEIMWDVLLIFIILFIVVVIQKATYAKGKSESTLILTGLKCTKCGRETYVGSKYCVYCSAPVTVENPVVTKDSSPIVSQNVSYLADEKQILKGMLFDKLDSLGKRNFETPTQTKMKNILLVIFGIITFITVIMFYFNYPLLLCISIELVNILICYLISKRFDTINVLMRQVMKNPDKDISVIVSELEVLEYTPTVNRKVLLSMVLIGIIIVPSLFFINPRVLYIKYDDGYAVFKYTRGIIDNPTELTIPEEHNGKKVLAISNNAFENSSIKAVHLPNGLLTIKYKAFRNCKNLTSIEIPNTVLTIRGQAFENDISLETVILHDGLEEIRGSVFKNNISLRNITLPDTLEYLGGGAFYHCSSLISITIPAKVTEINGETFKNCYLLEQVNLHDDIVSIHGENFTNDSNLKSIILPSKLTEVRGNTFENCSSLSEINIPDSVTRIGGHAFYGCSSLKKVNITENSSLKEIGSSAFRQCYSLYEITIPNQTTVNERAFKESPTSVKRFGGYGYFGSSSESANITHLYLSLNNTKTFTNGNLDSTFTLINVNKTNNGNEFTIEYKDTYGSKKIVLTRDNPSSVINDNITVEANDSEFYYGTGFILDVYYK